MFDYLGIDWGEKRFGLAFGSSSTGLVISADYLAPFSDIFDLIEIELKKRKISKVILGLPTNFKGGLTETSQKILEFLEDLKTHFPNLEIRTYHERGSTKTGLKQMKEAKTGKDKDLLNHLAAKKILEDYFSHELKI